MTDVLNFNSSQTANKSLVFSVVTSKPAVDASQVETTETLPETMSSQKTSIVDTLTNVHASLDRILAAVFGSILSIVLVLTAIFALYKKHIDPSAQTPTWLKRLQRFFNHRRNTHTIFNDSMSMNEQENTFYGTPHSTPV